MSLQTTQQMGGLPPSHEVYRRSSKSKFAGLIPKFGKKKAFSRRHRRYPCCVIASMDVIERG
jgi:hypothetical protein